MPDPRLEFADDELTAMLRSIDHALPPLSVDHVMIRARRRHSHRSMMIAAATFVVAAAAAAAAVPGFTVRDFFGQAPVARASHPAALPHHTTGAVSGSRGIAFVPEHRVLIVFAATQRSGSARVRFSSEPSVRITQSSDESSAQYGLTPDGVSVSNTGSAGSYEILIPATAPDVEVRIAGHTALTKSGARSTCLGVSNPGQDCVIPLQP